jgi:hypothetical protein
MAVSATDLVAYASAGRPTDDTSTSGGNISSAPTLRVFFSNADIAAADTVQILSDGADTRTFTVIGRKADGTEATWGPFSLTGATPLTSTDQFERIQSVILSTTDASRTVTLRRTTGATTITTIPPLENGAVRMFRNAASDPSVQKDFYELLYFKNNNGSSALLAPTISEVAGGLATSCTFGVGGAKGNIASVANRVTAPGGITFNDTAKTVPGTDLAAGEFIGVWVKLTLAAGTAGQKGTYTLQIAGSTT